MPEFIQNANVSRQVADSAKILNWVYSAYIEAVYFTDSGDSEDRNFPPDAALSGAAQFEAMRDCADFLAQCENDGLIFEYLQAGHGYAQLGHDFWLTRNGHGVGFWDRGLGDLGDLLTKAANGMGSVYTYTAGDTGAVFFS